MSTTIPNILRQLGNRYPTGFSLEDLKEALLMDGYGPLKVSRRVKQVQFSGEIIPTDNGEYVTLYNPYHLRSYPELFADLRIRPVKIERDGSVTYL